MEPMGHWIEGKPEIEPFLSNFPHKVIEGWKPARTEALSIDSNPLQDRTHILVKIGLSQCHVIRVDRPCHPTMIDGGEEVSHRHILHMCHIHRHIHQSYHERHELIGVQPEIAQGPILDAMRGEAKLPRPPIDLPPDRVCWVTIDEHTRIPHNEIQRTHCRIDPCLLVLCGPLQPQMNVSRRTPYQRSCRIDHQVALPSRIDVEGWFTSKDPRFLAEGIQIGPRHSNDLVEVDGDLASLLLLEESKQLRVTTRDI